MQIKILNLHIRKARKLAKQLLKTHSPESSVIIKHEIIVDTSGEEKLKTTITLLPSKRFYKTGDKIVDDDSLLKEIEEWKNY